MAGEFEREMTFRGQGAFQVSAHFYCVLKLSVIWEDQGYQSHLRQQTSYSSKSPGGWNSTLWSWSYLQYFSQLKICPERRLPPFPWVTGKAFPCPLFLAVLDFQSLLCLDFPGSPVVKILCFQCRGHGFNPYLENYVIRRIPNII